MGNEIIMNEYESLQGNKKFKIYPSIRFEKFLTLLKNAKYLIGNSSVGIMESCVYGIPTINIGNRQNGRYDKNTVRNIQTINCNEDDILNAIEKVDSYRIKSSSFGKGNSSELIVNELKNENFWKCNVQKFFCGL
jgi:UDP-N-acetylglucosamine 2-epimerase (hydrolysing)